MIPEKSEFASGNATPRPLNPENIPSELKAIPHWVCWRYEERNGKRTKPPINAKSNGRMDHAKSNDPATWADFDTALLACGIHHELAGIGYCFAPNDGLTGLDLDHVFNPETGELTPDAAEILARFAGTYAEISPSGTGLRLFCYGKPRRSGKNTGRVKWLEVYSHPSNRYLTVTGNAWAGNAPTITRQQAALDWLHDRFMESTEREPPHVDAKPGPVDPPNLDDVELLDKACRASNGADFERLWAGDTSAHGGDASAADLALCNLLAFWTGNDPARMDRLFRQSVLFRAGKWDKVHFADGRTYGQATIEKAIAGNRETYSGRKDEGRDHRGGAQDSGREPGCDDEAEPERGGADGISLDAYRGTDDANAELFLTMHGANVRYCPPWEKWLLWTGSHWRIDDRLDIDRLTADVPRLLYRRAGEAGDSGERRKIAALAGKLERTALRATMLVASRHRVVVHHSDLDKGHFLLNCRNGTVDLRTGTLRPHDRADLLTHDTEIRYDRDATAPTWIQFLHAVFAGDADLIQFVQRAMGYSLTGDVREQVLLICHGSGSNGKSVFLNILRQLLGKLAWQAAPDLLLADKQRRHPTEQADLFGKRVVVCQETGEGRRFNETLVKQLTGGDAITARRMHEDNWSFDPTHKLWLSTNHKPEIRGTDYAIWRRPRLIPFGVTFTDDGEPRKDLAMEARLLAELPGILAWSVRGCLDWQKHGLGMAAAVKAATANYQAEMDVLAAWLADCCVTGKRFEAKAADLYASYGAWCDASGETAEPQRRFGMRLTERGFTRQRRMVGIFWLGIGLKSPDHEPYEPYEPESAVFRAEINSRGNSAKSGSFHTYPTCAPDDACSSPLGDASPPVETPPQGEDWMAWRAQQLEAEGWAPANARAKALDEARQARGVRP